MNGQHVLDRRTTKVVSGWAPHYNDVHEHVDLEAGARFCIVKQEHQPWNHVDDEGRPVVGGHVYYLLEYEKGGKRKQFWARTYDIHDESRFSEYVPTEKRC